jgi:hypothetical protein
VSGEKIKSKGARDMEKKISVLLGADNGSDAPVWHQYPTQHNVQPAFISFCPGLGELQIEADYNAEIGNAVPMNVWNKKELRFGIMPSATRRSIEALAENEELAELLQKIIDGYDYDGQKGKYTEDAEDAMREIESLLEKEIDTVSVWSAQEWVDMDVVRIKDVLSAGGIDAYAENAGSCDCDNVIFGCLADAVAKNIARQLERVDAEDRNEEEKAAAAMLAEYNDDYKYIVEE